MFITKIQFFTTLSVKFIGVAATTIRATTAASVKQIAVAMPGSIVEVRCLRDNAGTYQTAIVPGELLCLGVDNAASYAGQVMVHAPTSGGTDPNVNSKTVAIALEAVAAAAATPVNIKVLLKARGQ